MYAIKYQTKHCAASLYPYFTWWKNLGPCLVIIKWNQNMFIFVKNVWYYINLDGDRIRACLDCPAEMECVIRLLWDCMYGVEKMALEWRLENCDKVDKYLNTSPLDWLNFDVSFHKQSLNQLHCLLRPTNIWMWKWDKMAKQNVCDFENGALNTEFNLTPKGCLWQDQTTFFKLAKEDFKFDFESEE